jgi:PPK2 family polyphosphate:nucleotide phosphotransferase
MNINKLKIDGSEEFDIKNTDTKVKDIYDSTEDYTAQLTSLRDELDELQSMMYAHNRYGMLVIFQAMDAAGKDSTIKHVFAGINPAGLRVVSFKRPSENELDHDFLWRTNLQLPERGTMTVFNRSYYEEVLVVKVHPNIITDTQHLPEKLSDDLDELFEKRYHDIANLEKYLTNNGIEIVKFFLHVSKKEQAERLLERLEDPTKNWKFEAGDLNERALWDKYQKAYEKAINATATKHAPWYVIPADDKKNMRLLVCEVLKERLKALKMNYPSLSAEEQSQIPNYIQILKNEL